MAKASFTDGGGKPGAGSSGSFEGGSKSSLKAKSSFTEGGKAAGGGRSSSVEKKVSFTGGGKASIESDGDGRKSKKKTSGSNKVKRLSLNADGSKSEKSDDDSDSDFTPRKDGDGGDDDNDSDDDTDVSEMAKGVFSAVQKYVNKKKKQLLKLFVNYGPPYNGKPFNPELINECCKPVLDYRKLHKILSKRGDPNMADPTDLYYTPMHWVARNLHFMAMKMLRKAGANVNVSTEMGVTPLDFVVMLKHPPDSRKTQLKMTEYLLRNGALVNTRDKGGLAPIDHAAGNQDFEICEMLLEAGAKLSRTNKIFVAERQPILSLVYDPAVYKLLYEALLKEEALLFEASEERRLVEEELQRKADFEKLMVSLDKKKKKKRERAAADKRKEHEDNVLAFRQAALDRSETERISRRAEVKVNNGVWLREPSGHWDLKSKTRDTLVREDVWEDSKARMLRLRAETALSNYDDKWTSITKGGRLEVPWKRDDPFKSLHDSLQDSLDGASVTSALTGYRTGAGSEFRDANDDLLGGVDDLDSLLSEL